MRSADAVRSSPIEETLFPDTISGPKKVRSKPKKNERSAACHNRGADGLPRRPIMSSSCAATTEINCTRPERSPLFAMYGGWIDRFRSESLTILTCDVDNWKKAAARHERPTSSEQELPDAVPFSSRRYCGREACLDSSTRPRRCTLTAATASCLSLGRVFRDLWPARVTVLPPRRQLHYSCDTGAAA